MWPLASILLYRLFSKVYLHVLGTNVMTAEETHQKEKSHDYQLWEWTQSAVIHGILEKHYFCCNKGGS